MTAHVQPSTYEDRVISRAKAARAACYGKPNVVNIAVALRLAPSDPNDLDEGRTFLTPVDFIRSRCALRGVTYNGVIAHDRAAAMITTRNLIIAETHRQYPDMPISQLAKFFRRNHSTVQYALGRIPEKKARMANSAERDRQARALYDKGFTLEAIAKELGIVESTVRCIKKRNKWDARSKPKPVRVEQPHEKEAYALWLEGLSDPEIAKRIGKHRSLIWVMKKRWDWPARKAGAA